LLALRPGGALDAQLQALRKLGCDLGQGYHLSIPLEPALVPA